MIADATWVYYLTTECKPTGEVDAEHVVQAQLEVQATGTSHAYLGHWTLLKGTAMYKAHYSVDFIKAVSTLLQANQYVCAAAYQSRRDRSDCARFATMETSRAQSANPDRKRSGDAPLGRHCSDHRMHVSSRCVCPTHSRASPLM
jgi:hypothetical protein